MSKKKCKIDAKTRYKAILEKKNKVLAELDPAVRKKLTEEGISILPFKPATVDEVADMIDELRNKYPDPSKFRSEAKKAIEEMKSERINKKIDFFEKQLKDMDLHNQIFGQAKNHKEAFTNMQNLFDVQLDNRINHLTAKNHNMLTTIFDESDLNILEKNDPNIIKQIYNTIESQFKDNTDSNLKEIGMKIKKFNDYLHAQQIEAGFRKGYLNDYTGPRTYDGEKLRKNKAQALVDYRESIDVEESFPGLDLRDPEDLAKFNKITENIIDGRIDANLYGSTINVASLDSSGRSNLEARQTRERKIKFKAGKEGEWAVKYGTKTILENLAAQSRTVAKVSATRELFGVNPRATSEKLLNELKLRTADDAPKIYEDINSEKYLERLWSPYDGSLERVVGSATLAKIFANIKTVLYMSKLGKTTLSAQADIANAIAILDAATGQGISKSSMDIIGQTIADAPVALKSYVTGNIPKNIQARAGELGIFYSSAVGEFLKKAGIDGEGSKFLTKVVDIYERVNPIGKQTAFHDMMAVTVFQNAFAKMLKQGGTPEIDISMKRAGMSPAYKDILLASIDDVKHEGNSAIIFSPEKVFMVDDEVAARVQKEMAKTNPQIASMSLEKFKTDTANRVQIMFDDFRNTAIPKPTGAIKRAMHIEGKGTLKGELANSLTMLKSFSVKMLEVNKRIMESGGDRSSLKMKRMTSFYTQMTMMGMWISTLHALSNNETPPDMTKSESWVKAITRGGAGGIYADLMLSATDENYNNLITGLAGPMAGAFQQTIYNPIGKLLNKGKLEGKDLKPYGRLLPAQNHLIFRPILDYMFIDAMDKAVDPKGHRRRYKMLRKKGQDKLIK